MNTETKITKEHEVKLAQFRELIDMMSKDVELRKYDLDVYIAAMVSHLAALAFSQDEKREDALKQLHNGLDSCFNDLKSEFSEHTCPH